MLHTSNKGFIELIKPKIFTGHLRFLHLKTSIRPNFAVVSQSADREYTERFVIPRPLFPFSITRTWPRLAADLAAAAARKWNAFTHRARSL